MAGRIPSCIFFLPYNVYSDFVYLRLLKQNRYFPLLLFLFIKFLYLLYHVVNCLSLSRLFLCSFRIWIKKNIKNIKERKYPFLKKKQRWDLKSISQNNKSNKDKLENTWFILFSLKSNKKINTHNQFAAINL